MAEIDPPGKGQQAGGCGTVFLNRKQQLMAFLDYGDVPISNNLAENAIRPFVVGRQNWLFCVSVKGAESSAIVYSLVAILSSPLKICLRIQNILSNHVYPKIFQFNQIVKR